MWKFLYIYIVMGDIDRGPEFIAALGQLQEAGKEWASMPEISAVFFEKAPRTSTERMMDFARKLFTVSSDRSDKVGTGGLHCTAIDLERRGLIRSRYDDMSLNPRDTHRQRLFALATEISTTPAENIAQAA